MTTITVGVADAINENAEHKITVKAHPDPEPFVTRTAWLSCRIDVYKELAICRGTSADGEDVLEVLDLRTGASQVYVDPGAPITVHTTGEGATQVSEALDLRYERITEKPMSAEFTDHSDSHVTARGVRCTQHSPHSILVRIPGMAAVVWIPLSQVSADSEVRQRGDEGDLIITRWLAEQKGWV